MGEFADMAIDAMIDGQWGSSFGRRRRRSAPIIKTCHHCGEDDLRWQNVKGGGWRLHTRDGKLHICKRGTAIETFMDQTRMDEGD